MATREQAVARIRAAWNRLDVPLPADFSLADKIVTALNALRLIELDDPNAPDRIRTEHPILKRNRLADTEQNTAAPQPEPASSLGTD